MDDEKLMKPKSSLSLTPMESGKVIYLLMTVLVCGGCASGDRSEYTPGEISKRAADFGLVDVRQVAPEVFVDLRYRSSRNVLGQRLYPADMPCLLKRDTARKLRTAAEFVARYGYALKVWDGWRPPEVQALFHDKLGHTGMFLDPKLMWSRHCTGTAVDITLVTTRGKEVDMPTDHDVEGERAHHDAKGASPDVLHRLAILQNAMSKAGFLLIDIEWWHFDDGEYAFRQPRVVSATDLGLTLPQ